MARLNAVLHHRHGSVMDIDRQRINAVRTLEALGFRCRNGEWLTGDLYATALFTAEADAMHGALMRRADALAGCAEGSDQEAELSAISAVVEACEAKRWPDGKEPGRRG
jgi:hypothetical protein